jgi:RES domain-containing protein
LAVLEVRVHLDLPFDLLPVDYVLLRVVLPSDGAASLGSEPPNDPQAAGDRWLAAGEAPVLRVPSVLVPRAHNLLLNPRHPRAAEAAVAERLPFRFDARMWAVGAGDVS